MNINRLRVIAFMLFFVTACVHMDGPYKGKVVELETGEPIEGAVVAAVWIVEKYNILPPDFCDAKETLTGKGGEYLLPRGWCFKFWPFTYITKPSAVVFKPGYLGYPPLSLEHMPGYTGADFKDTKLNPVIKLGKPKTREERVLTLDHADIVRDESIKKYPLLITIINEERVYLGYEKVYTSDEKGESK